MKKIACFLIVPAIFICSRISYLNNMYELGSYMIFFLVDFMICSIIYGLMQKMRKQWINMVLIIFIGSTIDQVIKLIIYKRNLNFRICGGLMQIKQTKNMNQMAVLNSLNIELNTIIIVIMKSVIVIVLLIMFFKIEKRNHNLIYAFCMLLMAAISNLADSLFWGYTLDYVYFYHLTCYDLKDFYVDAAIGCVIIGLLKNEISLEMRKQEK